MCTPDLSLWADIATIVGAGAAVAALIYTARKILLNTLVHRGQFWLEIEKMFSNHDDVHIKLRPSGEWTKPDSGPEKNKEWAQVEDYMGLFEHCEIMLEANLIDWKTFRTIYSYRLHNIVRNKKIVEEKLKKEQKAWTKFIHLLSKLGISPPEYTVYTDQRKRKFASLKTIFKRPAPNKTRKTL